MGKFNLFQLFPKKAKLLPIIINSTNKIKENSSKYNKLNPKYLNKKNIKKFKSSIKYLDPHIKSYMHLITTNIDELH